MSSASSAKSVNDLAIVKRRLFESLVARSRASSPDVITRAHRDLDSLRPDGGWADIDYQDQSMMGEWQAATHLDRLLVMAAVYRRPGGRSRRALGRGAMAALDFWLRRDFTNPNWWWNQIGVPQGLGHVLILMEDHLTPAQLATGLKIMARNDWSKHTGQNLVWGTGIQIVRGCLAGEQELVAAGFARTAREIRVARPGKEGIQTDCSFHQHGAVLYSGGYGLNFACDCAALVALARDTRFAFQEKTVSVFSGYLLDGQQWMVRGHTFDYTAVGREITRKGKSAAGLADACEDMMLVDEARREEFAAFRRRLRGEGTAADALTGNRHFWKSDLMTHQRPGFYASVRMFSDRLDNTDWVCSGEGKRSHYLADGITYLYRRGDEYRDIFPVWDWRRVPGITVEYLDPHPGSDAVRTRGERSFVGGVSDGRYGMSAMDFARGALTARKAWFFFDREFVCLGAGIACASENGVLTSVNQCRARGSVTMSRGGAVGRQEAGEHALRGPLWVHHDGVGYLFPKPADIVLRDTIQRGDWTEIGTGTAGVAAERVFSLWLEHGRRVADADYSYIVVPDTTRAEMAAYAKKPPVTILANTAQLQAVRHPALGLTQAAFYEAGTLAMGDDFALTVDQPCLLMVHEAPDGVQFVVANPENRPLTVQVDVSLPLRGLGCRWLPAKRVSRIAVRLPGGPRAGASVVRKFRRSSPARSRDEQAAV